MIMIFLVETSNLLKGIHARQYVKQNDKNHTKILNLAESEEKISVEPS